MEHYLFSYKTVSKDVFCTFRQGGNIIEVFLSYRGEKTLDLKTIYIGNRHYDWWSSEREKSMRQLKYDFPTLFDQLIMLIEKINRSKNFKSVF